MRNEALSPDPIAATRTGATGCGARFELALIAAFKGGAMPLAARPPHPRG